MVISRNLQALNTNRIANENIELQGKSTEKVSSGYKINHVGDDPVGLAMSETMRRQIRGLNQGIENTKAAINFCQTADGALNEVTEMLQRINELAVKAENGTNLKLDRHYLQAEVDQLLTEIDRVADTTTFNEIPIFRWGLKEYVSAPSGPSIVEGDIPFSDFTLAPFTLENLPFGETDFGAFYNHPNIHPPIGEKKGIKLGVFSPTSNKEYGMLYWYRHSFRFSTKDGTITNKQVNLNYNVNIKNNYPTKDELEKLNEGLYLITDKYDFYAGNDISKENPYCQRTFLYKYDDDVILEITQKITADIYVDPNGEKKYNILYEFTNLGNKDVALDFVTYMDTAYGRTPGESRYCQNENYYVKDGDGNKQKETCIFADGKDGLKKIFSESINPQNISIKEKIPDSFSMIDPKGALEFSEKISFEQNSKPIAMSIGNPYDSNRNLWDYDAYTEKVGNDDWGFSLYWNLEVKAVPPSQPSQPSQLSFNYGIAPYEQDDNIHGDEINKKPDIIGEPEPEPHYEKKNLWIQTGSEKGSGLWLEIDEMNTEVLGIDKIDLTTIEGAADANIRVKEALRKLAVSRSKIGAQQNRLEHTVVNEENIVEKVTASESRIRDTDLSSEMVRYSNLSVLLQIGQNMIAQADQRVEKILTILQ